MPDYQNGIETPYTSTRRTDWLSTASHGRDKAKISSVDALRYQMDQELSVGPSTEASSAAKSRIYGLPTPPYSETTSSASGSVGRSRKDSNDAFPSSHKSPSLQRLELPSAHHDTASALSRSSSAASSSTNTGSDTIGGSSLVQPHDSSFRREYHTSAAGPSLTQVNSTSRMDKSPTKPAEASPAGARASSSLSSHAGSTQSPSGRRPRRSELHERDVTQLRSESRLGFEDDDDDDVGNEQQQHPFPRSASQHKYSPRKSTTLSVSSSRYDAEESLGDVQSPTRQGSHDLDSGTAMTHSSARSSRYTGGDELPSGSMRRLVCTTGRSSGRHSLDARTSSNNTSSTRSPMPAEFRLPDKEIRRAYRAAHQRRPSADESDRSDGREEMLPKPRSSELSGDSNEIRSPVSTHRDSLDEIKEEGAKNLSSSSRSPIQRRRYASDAAADENTAPLDYAGRLGTQGSRISVDVSFAQRHLSRGSQHSTPSSATRRFPRSSEIGSPSEEARARKISSTSSNRSQKSSSSASELHRAASRVSMRKQYGSGLFSADAVPPPATTSARPHSPSVRTEHSSSLTNSSDRPRQYNDRLRRMDDAALDNLRNQIEDLRVGRAGSEHDKRQQHLPSLRAQALLGTTRSSLDLESPVLGSTRPQSVMGLQRSPNDSFRPQHMHQYPSTDPQRSRYDRALPTPDPNNSSDAANRIHELVGFRGGPSRRASVPQRSATSLGTSPGHMTTSPVTERRERMASNGEEPAPIRNLAIRLTQYEALYSKTPVGDPNGSAAVGSHTARTVELMGAIVRGTSTMWAELSSMHPIATEGHLMGRPGDAFTDAFGQLDEGLAFVNKLVLEQARAIQDLLFLLDRTEKERQAQFNQALVEMGHSPRPFSRIGGGVSAAGLTPGDAYQAAGGGAEAGSAHLLRRATSSVRGGSSLQADSPSPFVRSTRGLGSGERGGTLTASQIRSMTSLGHTSNHGRSASELSPSSSAAQRRLDRSALQLPPETSQDSPLSSRRSVIGRPFPSSSDASSTAGANSASAGSARPPLAFTPRRPRLSNPSVSNATASFQPSATSAASSVVASSPENSLQNGVSGMDQVESEGSTIGGGGQHGSLLSETDEFGRVIAGNSRSLPPGDMARLSSRQRTRQVATIRGNGPHRVADTLAAQLDTFRTSTEEQDLAAEETAQVARTASTHRRHTINFHNTNASPSSSLADGENTNRQPTKLTRPPRPPRNISRPSEESIHSPARKTQLGQRNEPSTPTAAAALGGDVGTPRATDRQAYRYDDVEGSGASSVVRSLGRTAARRVSRVLGSGQ
ncbi:hypothetical protein NDA10_000221 [Ustilago hordei]|nr:hypothetical protein NDA10_000221 [Ustilago hordei]